MMISKDLQTLPPWKFDQVTTTRTSAYYLDHVESCQVTFVAEYLFVPSKNFQKWKQGVSHENFGNAAVKQSQKQNG